MDDIDAAGWRAQIELATNSNELQRICDQLQALQLQNPGNGSLFSLTVTALDRFDSLQGGDDGEGNIFSELEWEQHYRGGGEGDPDG